MVYIRIFTMKPVFPACLAAVALLASCSTTKTIYVFSRPEGADILVNGKKVGRTPGGILVDQKYPVEIVLEKPGYATTSRTLTPEPSTMGKILWTSDDPRSNVIRENEVTLRMEKLSAPKILSPRPVPRPAPRVQPPALRRMPEF